MLKQKYLLKRPQNRKINTYFIIFIIQSFTIKKGKNQTVHFVINKKWFFFQKWPKKLKNTFWILLPLWLLSHSSFSTRLECASQPELRDQFYKKLWSQFTNVSYKLERLSSGRPSQPGLTLTVKERSLT